MYHPVPMMFSVMILSAALLADPSPGAESPVKVIVNASNPVTSLSREQVSQLFLRKKDRWDDGRTVEVVEPGDRGLQERFAREFHQKSWQWVEHHWLELEGAARGRRPVVRAKEEAVVALVAKDQGAIAYLSHDPGDPRVKVISVTP